MAFDALVRGALTEPAGSDPVVVPRGHCKVETHEGVVSLLWEADDGEAHSVTLAAGRFERHLDSGAIVILDAAQLSAGEFFDR